MRRLDFYVQHMLKQNAQSIAMRSGEAVEFRFGGGKQRRSNQPISHKQLVQLVREVASPEALDELRRSGRVRFTPSGGEAVHVRVEASAAETWLVLISVSDAADEEPAAGAHGHEAAPEQSDEWALPSEQEAFGGGTASRSLPP